MSRQLRNKITEILEEFAKGFAEKEVYTDTISWWGHDTDLGDMKEWFDEYTDQFLQLFKSEKEKLLKRIRLDIREISKNEALTDDCLLERREERRKAIADLENLKEEIKEEEL